MFRLPNYGSVLQTFASQIILKRLKYNCDIINYEYPNKWHFDNGYYKPNVLKNFIRNIVKQFGYKTSGEKLKEHINLFIKKNLQLTSTKFTSLESLEHYNWHIYSTVITGSDQVWNPRFMKGDKAFLLSFVPNNINRISLSSSFACKTIESKYINIYKKYLTKYSNLSVRDNQGINILKELEIDKPVRVLLDPTLLLSYADWIETLNISQNCNEEYILVYLLNYAFNPSPYIYNVAKEMQRRFGIKVIFIGNIDNKLASELNNYEIKEYVPVETFVSLFANANMVITSSFHGTAFAINFSKPLIAIIPSNGDDRQYSLLKNLGIAHCAVTIETPIKKINPYYDEKSICDKLIKIRSEDIKWLKDSLT